MIQPLLRNAPKSILAQFCSCGCSAMMEYRVIYRDIHFALFTLAWIRQYGCGGGGSKGAPPWVGERWGWDSVPILTPPPWLLGGVVLQPCVRHNGSTVGAVRQYGSSETTPGGASECATITHLTPGPPLRVLLQYETAARLGPKLAVLRCSTVAIMWQYSRSETSPGRAHFASCGHLEPK